MDETLSKRRGRTPRVAAAQEQGSPAEVLQARADAAAKGAAVIKMTRGGVTSEHGAHNEGDIVETELAGLFIQRGWAEPV